MAIALTSAFAQKTNDKKDKTKEYKRTPEQVATDYTTKLEKVAGITAEQKTKIYDLKLKEVQDVRALVADKTLKPADRQAKIKDVRKTFRAEMKNILTPEQKEKLKAAKQEKEKKEKKGKKDKKDKKDESEKTESGEPTDDVD
jgi:hypothetical protein